MAIVVTQIAAHADRKIAPLALLAALSLAPNPRWISWFNLTSNFSSTYQPLVPPAFFNPSFVASISGKSYIVLPYNTFGGLWDAVSGMKFHAFGVYGILNYSGILRTQKSRLCSSRRPPMLEPLVNQGQGKTDAPWAASLTKFFQTHHIDGIMLDEDPWAPSQIIPVLLQAGWDKTGQRQAERSNPPKTARRLITSTLRLG